MFGVSKFDLGTLVYERIRERMVAEDPDPQIFAEEKNFYERSHNEALSATLYVKKVIAFSWMLCHAQVVERNIHPL